MTDDLMKTYYVQATDETDGISEIFAIYVECDTCENVSKNIEMAKKYAFVEREDEPSNYDEHFEDMVEYREAWDTDDTFIYYLEEHCGYDVKPFDFDFEFVYGGER